MALLLAPGDPGEGLHVDRRIESRQGGEALGGVDRRLKLAVDRFRQAAGVGDRLVAERGLLGAKRGEGADAPEQEKGGDGRDGQKDGRSDQAGALLRQLQPLLSN